MESKVLILLSSQDIQSLGYFPQLYRAQQLLTVYIGTLGGPHHHHHNSFAVLPHNVNQQYRVLG